MSRETSQAIANRLFPIEILPWIIIIKKEIPTMIIQSSIILLTWQIKIIIPICRIIEKVKKIKSTKKIFLKVFFLKSMINNITFNQFPLMNQTILQKPEDSNLFNKWCKKKHQKDPYLNRVLNKPIENFRYDLIIYNSIIHILIN